MECVDGSSVPPYDPMVIDVAEQVEDIVVTCPSGDKITLEIEGRLGSLIDTITEDRVRIPTETEAVLTPPEEGLEYRFDPGVTAEQFKSVVSLVDLKAVEERFDSRTQEEYYAAEDGATVRLTYPDPRLASSRPIACISKEFLRVFNVYSGRDQQEDTQTPQARKLDFRIAVNTETKVPYPMKLPRVFARRRHRTSYRLKNKLQIDLTEVHLPRDVVGPSRNETSEAPSVYEVEVEIDGDFIRQQVELKRQHKPHHLYDVTADFLQVLKTWTTHLNNTTVGPVTSNSGPQLLAVSLAQCKHNKELQDGYLKYIGPTEPIIGDYLYRAIAPSLKGRNEGLRKGTVNDGETSCHPHSHHPPGTSDPPP